MSNKSSITVGGGGMFTDDFESGNLNNWTIGGRQQGNNTAEVIVLNDSNVAHLYHKDFTEITLEKIFDFDEGLKFSFDIAVSIYNARGPSSADYAKAGVGFFFYDSSDQLLGYTEYVKSTSSYPYGADGGDTLEFMPMNYTSSMQHYEIGVREALDKISINESSIDKVKFRAVTYNSGWGYSNYAHLWLDNVEVEVDAYDAKLNSTCGNPYGFAGMRYDAESGLYHTLYRSYESEMGRWIQPDPLGTVPNDDISINPFAPEKQYDDGLNLYGSFGNNPINYTDYFGLKKNCHLYLYSDEDGIRQPARRYLYKSGNYKWGFTIQRFSVSKLKFNLARTGCCCYKKLTIDDHGKHGWDPNGISTGYQCWGHNVDPKKYLDSSIVGSICPYMCEGSTLILYGCRVGLGSREGFNPFFNSCSKIKKIKACTGKTRGRDCLGSWKTFRR